MNDKRFDTCKVKGIAADRQYAGTGLRAARLIRSTGKPVPSQTQSITSAVMLAPVESDVHLAGRRAGDIVEFHRIAARFAARLVAHEIHYCRGVICFSTRRKLSLISPKEDAHTAQCVMGCRQDALPIAGQIARVGAIFDLGRNAIII